MSAERPQNRIRPHIPRLAGKLALVGVCAGLSMGIAAPPAVGMGAIPHSQADPSGGAEPTPAALPFAMLENRRILSYPFGQVWPTAVRYLRIDRGFTVTDRDEEAGYILFDFPLEGGRRGAGSIEMFTTEDASGRPSVSVKVATGSGPISLPNTILDGLATKVRSERGQPANPPKPEPPAPPEQDEPEDDHSVPLMPPATDP